MELNFGNLELDVATKNNTILFSKIIQDIRVKRQADIDIYPWYKKVYLYFTRIVFNSFYWNFNKKVHPFPMVFLTIFHPLIMKKIVESYIPHKEYHYIPKNRK